MKKIRCDFRAEDYIQISPIDSSDIVIGANQGGRCSSIRIGPAKIRKLRKQLKRALMKIEGVSDDRISTSAPLGRRLAMSRT